MSDQNKFGAAHSAVGYIYQIRYALLLGLKKIIDSEDPDDCVISIEKLDDIAFEQGGSPIELLQTKHHSNPGNITDRSPDIWKTLRIWAEAFKDNFTTYQDSIFTLITTETATENSLAFYLSPNTQNRNVDLALASIEKIILETDNKTNQPAYKAFVSLTPIQRKHLLKSTFIIGNSEDILQTEHQIKRHLQLTTERKHIDAFTSRLEGSWFKRCIEHLESNTDQGIYLSELIFILDDLRQQFHPDNLPSDYDDLTGFSNHLDIENDNRIFVRQLKLIGASNSVIELAILNHNKAFRQRSKWLTDNLVLPGEMNRYLNLLESEWRQQKSLLEMEAKCSSQDNDNSLGFRIYSTCYNNCAIPIRPNFQSLYVARGSYEHLSDARKIGWHPKFRELLHEASNDGVISK